MKNLKNKILNYAGIACLGGAIGTLVWPREIREGGNEFPSYKASKLQEVEVKQYEAEFNDNPDLHIVYIDEAPFGDVNWVYRKNRASDGVWRENGLISRPSPEDLDSFNRLRVE